MPSQVEAGESPDWSGLSSAHSRQDARSSSGPAHIPEPIIAPFMRSLIQPTIPEHQVSDGLVVVAEAAQSSHPLSTDASWATGLSVGVASC